MSAPRHNHPYPIIGVGAVVFKDRSVLLIRRSKPPKQDEWSLPGGAQELGETVRQAVHRELWEETGIKADIRHLVEVIDYIEPALKSDKGSPIPHHHFTLIDFAGVWTAGTPRAGSDAAEARWIDLADLGDFTLWDETRHIIEEAYRLVFNKPINTDSGSS